MINTSPSDQKNSLERPPVFKVLFILAVLSVIGIIPLATSDVAKSIGDWYPPYLIVSFIIGISCFVAIWNMKKLGFWAYVVFVASNQIIMLATGIWSIGALIIPGLVIFFVSRHLDKMN
jgi:hypothetical protein